MILSCVHSAHTLLPLMLTFAQKHMSNLFSTAVFFLFALLDVREEEVRLMRIMNVHLIGPYPIR